MSSSATSPAAARGWSPSSWREREALQQPDWPQERLEVVRDRLAALPPLVFAGEARELEQSLAEVAAGRAFLLQAGDCAESFRDFSAASIREKLRIILQMSVVLTYGAQLPVVKLGRIAGQFAKPRSSDFELVNGVAIPSFRGHMVHDDAATAEARVPTPKRLLQGYNQSAQTLNLLRAFAKGGFASLERMHGWNQEFVASSPAGRRYELLTAEIERALGFMRAIGVDVQAATHDVNFFVSHEALLLDYEEALTRRDSLTGDWYDCSAHLLWVGDRTRDPDGAHVEFLSGIGNPVAAKIGPATTAEELLALCARLDPLRRPGRLTLIARMGAGNVFEALPPLIRAVSEAGHPVVWASDPMHGNTRLEGSHKTRHFDDVYAEVEGFFAACRLCGVWPGGIHIEFTGEDVTECLGGSEEVLEEHLPNRYETLCDPRLNARQSLDLAFHLAELMRG